MHKPRKGLLSFIAPTNNQHINSNGGSRGMTNTSSFSAIAAERLQAMRQQHNQEQKQSEANGNTSIEVPAAITNLITGSDFWVVAKTNRYKKLIREGHLANLLELASIALTK